MNSYILPTYNRAKLSFHKGKGSYLITKKGRKLLEEISDDFNDDILKNITESEASQLSDLLDKLR